MEYFTLNDGCRIPAVGFGTFQIPADGSTYQAVRQALDLGIRHIDTAVAYFNEQEVGQAVRDSGIPRSEIWITSKLWLQDFHYEDARKAIALSLEKLGTDYVDLYLIHQPYGAVDEAWSAMEEARKEGRIRSLGVSNMTPRIWEAWVPRFSSVPSVNQVEFNPHWQQRPLREILDRQKVRLEAWAPLGQGRADLLCRCVLRGSGATWNFLTLSYPRRRWGGSAPWIGVAGSMIPTLQELRSTFWVLSTSTRGSDVTCRDISRQVWLRDRLSMEPGSVSFRSLV